METGLFLPKKKKTTIKPLNLKNSKKIKKKKTPKLKNPIKKNHPNGSLLKFLTNLLN
jgi:hypothetical protein